MKIELYHFVNSCWIWIDQFIFYRFRRLGQGGNSYPFQHFNLRVYLLKRTHNWYAVLSEWLRNILGNFVCEFYTQKHIERFIINENVNLKWDMREIYRRIWLSARPAEIYHFFQGLTLNNVRIHQLTPMLCA